MQKPKTASSKSTYYITATSTHASSSATGTGIGSLTGASVNQSGGLSTGAKEGLGIGLGVGLFVLFALLAALFFVFRKRRAGAKERKPLDEVESSTGSVQQPVVDGEKGSVRSEAQEVRS